MTLTPPPSSPDSAVIAHNITQPISLTDELFKTGSGSMKLGKVRYHRIPVMRILMILLLA
jgi:hypothetical protein